MSKEEANLLYIAVSTDSGCFCYGNTTAETLRAAAHLIDNGAENAMLNKLFFRSYSFARLKLESMVYAGLQSFRDHKINLASETVRYTLKPHKVFLFSKLDEKRVYVSSQNNDDFITSALKKIHVKA